MELNKSLQPEKAQPEALMNAEGFSRYMCKIFGLMCLGLSLTAFMAMMTGNVEALYNMANSSTNYRLALIGIELFLIILLSSRLQSMSAAQAIFGFLLYSLVAGLTFSGSIFTDNVSAIAKTLFIAAGTFGFVGLMVLSTKLKMTTLGGLLSSGLIGLIIFAAIHYFSDSSKSDYTFSSVGLIVNMVVTAYIIQKFKRNHERGEQRPIIIGALCFYIYLKLPILILFRLLGITRD